MNMRCRWLLLLILLFGLTSCDRQQATRIGGGPQGGTFQGYAEALTRVFTAVEPGRAWKVLASGGSVSNLEKLSAGRVDLALVYAGDAWLQTGRGKGQVPVRALTRLYGAPAHLVVAATSPYASVVDLTGARIAIGNPGSGTAAAARRYFASIRLWQKIVPVHIGFRHALDELERGAVDAVWMVVGSPNPTLVAETETMGLRFIDLISEARQSEFFRRFPFYVPRTLPPGTYPGQQRPIRTFEDSALLLGRADLPERRVRRLLDYLFSSEGHARLVRLHPVGRELTRERGLEGVSIPLHPGAELFWRGEN